VQRVFRLAVGSCLEISCPRRALRYRKTVSIPASFSSAGHAKTTTGTSAGNALATEVLGEVGQQGLRGRRLTLRTNEPHDLCIPAKRATRGHSTAQLARWGREAHRGSTKESAVGPR
jgi:hypothetical protein